MANRNSGRRDPSNRHGFSGNTIDLTRPPQQGRGRGKRRKRKVDIPVRKPSIPISYRTIKKDEGEKITYVIDTNVLLYAYEALFKFDEHDVCLVGQVWTELDKFKRGMDEKGFNARHLINAVDQLIEGKTAEELQDGVPLIPPANLANGKDHTGKLFFDFAEPGKPTEALVDLSHTHADDRILMVCLALQAKEKRVVLITNDSSMRVKARVAGIESEKYLSDITTSVIGEEDTYTGLHWMPEDFWDTQEQLVVATVGSVSEYKLKSHLFKKVNCNEFLYFPRDELTLIVTEKISPHVVVAETIIDYSNQKVWGVTARNLEQVAALHLLLDPRIPGVSLGGKAGSGKTFLALAAGLRQVMDDRRYDEIIITRPVVGSEKDIGFLPGDEREKMDPWMGAVTDNLEMLTRVSEPEGEKSSKDQNWARGATNDLLSNRITIRSLNFMKGRNFTRKFIICDETQDVSPKTLKMIATRVGFDSKIVFCGNVAQIDDPYLTEHTCGTSKLIRDFADSRLLGHITLQRGERSPFATEAEDRL